MRSTIALAPAALLLAGPLRAAPRVELFSPQGLVKQVRQVSVRFPEPMVPFGDPRGLLEPFRVDCPAKGTARWADGRNWIFDFDQDLPDGIRCEFTLREGLKTLAGSALEGQRTFAFTTGGPSIRASEPYEGGRISEDQIFILTLGAEADERTVLDHAAFSVDGLPQRVGVRIVSGAQAEAVLEAVRHRYGWARPEGSAKRPSPPALLLQARQNFPNDARVALIWGKGVATKSGIATEEDQTLYFKARPAFTAEFTCERVGAREGCLPFAPMALRFSAPVPWRTAKAIAITGKGGKKWKPKRPRNAEPEEDDEGEDEEGGDSGGDFVQWLTFPGPFPARTDLRVELPKRGLIDDSGRALVNAGKFPLAVRTGEFPPLAKFSGRFGILELNAEPVLPFTVRNLEAEVKTRFLSLDGISSGVPGLIQKVRGSLFKVSSTDRVAPYLEWLGRVQRYETWDKSVFAEGAPVPVKELAIPKPHGAKAFEVLGIPLKEPGFYVVELESRILGEALFQKPQSMYVPTAVLVTNLSVHFKWGRESSLAWVTTLDKGAPAPGVDVTVGDCRGGALWSGKTDPSGVARIPALPPRDRLARCEDYQGPMRGTRLFVSAKSGNDFSFVLDNWDQGIEPWRFEVPYEYGPSGAAESRTIFDRTLLRAGETVHMKHLLRRATMEGFSVPPEGDFPRTVVLEHEGSGQKYELPLRWDSSGVAETAWDIPKDAKLGVYEVSMSGERGVSGSFRVEEFRVPLLRATIQPPRDAVIGATAVPVDLSVRYLAGGALEDAPVVFRSRLQPRAPEGLEAFEGFVFANGPPRERRWGREASAQEPELRVSKLALDKTGGARVVVDGLPVVRTPMDLAAELEFRDPNGEIQTVASRIALWPSQWLVGIKPDSWAMSKKSFKVFVAVADLSGKPVAGAPVALSLLERRVYSHRKRLVGGFYAYDHSEKLVRLGSVCPGKTDAKGLLICEAPSPVSGNVVVQASVKDGQGRESTANTDVWVAGDSGWWYAVGDSDRMDVLPEKKRYEPGQEASFQVRMPFESATALVTVEREGILDAYVRKLSRKRPVVRVPVKGSYAPNVFVSVLAVRGRVGGPRPTALVDLGRPAYRLGIAEINVGWRAHELKVSVRADKDVYKVREKAVVTIKAASADGAPLPPGAEAAVAAVDEGLLELMPNRSWDLLASMMGRRPLAVATYTAQMHVVGKRHFGLKALPQGGGGGKQTTRELFDTLLLWKGRVPLGARGEATVEVPLNDSITSFRIAAVANAGAGLFGTGETSIRSTQDLVILSGLAPVVREGDRVQAHFTVRNTTAETLKLRVSATAEGLAAPLAPLDASLAPNEAKELGWTVDVPVGVDKIAYEVHAEADGGPGDRIKVLQKVVPAVPVRVFQATLAQVDGRLTFPVERPADAIPGRGGVHVDFRPSLGTGLSGILDYMRAYPYGCLEQRVSKAVALRDEAAWSRIVADLPAYLDSDGLAKYFPTMSEGCDCLTSYVVSVADEAGWTIPDPLQSRMNEGLANFVGGRINRGSPLPTADLTIRKLAALEALSRSGKADPGMIGSLSLEPNLWPTSAVLDWLNVLKRTPQAPDRERRLAEAEQILRSRLNFQGTTMGFSTDTSDPLWWLMVSNDVNAVRMILAHLGAADWAPDMPRLVRGAVGRQQRGHWDLTVANAWGRLALEKFSEAYERTPVSGSSRATLASDSRTMEWSVLPQGGEIALPWPAGMEKVVVEHEGAGRPWATVSSLAAIPLKEPLSTGYRIKKTWIPLEQRQKGVWSRGDVVRVRLELEAQSDMTWVVVDDPIPSGASILGTGLGRDSGFATQGEKREGWAWPAFEERSLEAFRAYYEYVPKGSWTVEYTMRLNNDGWFHLPATRTEAMYSPEMLGELPNAAVEVQP